MDTIDQLNRHRRSLQGARAVASPQQLAGAGAPPSDFAAVPLDPTGVPFVIDPDDRANRPVAAIAAVAAARGAATPAPGRQPSRAMTMPDTRSWCWRAHRTVHRQLPERRASTGCRSASRWLTPPSRCRKCGYRLRWYRQHPGASAGCCCAARCRKCGVAVSSQYPLVELVTGAVVRAGHLADADRAAAGIAAASWSCILIALFGIDLEHQILPNAITLPGIVIGLLFSLVAPPGWKDALIGVAARRRHSLRDCRRVLPVAARRRAWAWAT